MATTRHLMCDQPPCRATGPDAESAEAAKNLARRDGWDVGPREIRAGVFQFTDYCAAHRKAEQ